MPNIKEIIKKRGDRMGFDLSYFLKNGLWITLQQSIGTLSGLILAMAFARLVDKDIFGKYQLIVSIVYFMSIVTLPGLNIATARSVARGNEGDYAEAVRKSFLFGLIGIPLLIAIGTYYYFFLAEPKIGIALGISAFIFPFLYAPNTWHGFLLGKHMFKLAAKFDITQAIFTSGCLIITMFLLKDNLIILVFVYCFSFAASNLMYYFLSKRHVVKTQTDPSTLRYGIFLTFNHSTEVFSEHLDKIIIGMLLSPADLAVFSIVSFIPLKFRNLSKPFMNLFFPKLAASKATLEDALNKNKGILKIFIAFLLLGGIIYFLLIEKFSAIFFGAQYNDNYYLSKYFVLFIILAVPLMFLTKYAQAKKKRLAIFVTGPIFVIIKSVMIIVGIYWQGLLGAIIAFNLATLIRFILAVFLTKKTYE